MASVRLSDIRKAFRETQILHGVSQTVVAKRGEADATLASMGKAVQGMLPRRAG
jgi:hypothetical protein